MIEYGIVREASDNSAVVALKRKSECDKCGICKLGFDDSSCVLTARCDEPLQNGDYVKVEVFDAKLRLGSILIYLLPLALTALGAGLGILMSAGASAILAVCGLIVGLAFAVPIDIFVFRRTRGLRPHVLETCSQDDYEANFDVILKSKKKPVKSANKDAK